MDLRFQPSKPPNTRNIPPELCQTPVNIYQKDFTANNIVPGVQMSMYETDVFALDRVVQHSTKGLYIEFKRPIYKGKLGIFSVLPLLGKILQNNPYFMLTARFQRPKLSAQGKFEAGNYAAVLAMSLNGSIGGDLIGTTSVFLPNGGQMLNVLGKRLSPRNQISSNLTATVMDPQNPAIFTLSLCVNAADPLCPKGRSQLFIGDSSNVAVDSVEFDFDPNYFKTNTIADFRVGLGTASGNNYTVSLNILSFNVWVNDPRLSNSFSQQF